MELQNLKVEKYEVKGHPRSKYFFSSKLLNKILGLLGTGDRCNRDKIVQLLDENKDTYEINREFLVNLIECISSNLDIILGIGYIKPSEESEEFLKIYVDNFNKALDEYAKYRNSQVGKKVNGQEQFNLDFYFSEGKILSFLKLAEEVKKRQQLYYSFRDLFEAKESVEESLRYCATEEEIDNFISKYNRCIESHDLEKMKEALEYAQQLILKHWEEYITKVGDYRQGKPFKFICHSTSTTEFSGEFYTKYVSASLITNEAMATYRDGFGFVLEPKNIVGADSKDLYAINNASKAEELLTYSTIRRIKAPEIVIDECVELEKENREKGKIGSTYNEVVIDGFNPIGIFCLTDGSKELDYNYKCAKKLQQQFPQLELIEIDKTLYLTEDKLTEAKRTLLKNVMTAHAERDPKYADLDYEFNFKVTDEMVKSYGVFFTEYMALKQKGEYSSEDILKLYGKVKKMLEMNFLSSYAFDGYTDEEVKIILLYNTKLRIIDILEGKINLYTLDQIYNNLRNHVANERLSVIPGLNDFLRLYKKVTLTKEQIEELKQSSTLKEISEHLKRFIEVQETDKTNELIRQKGEYEAKIAECEEKIASNREKIAEHNIAQKIVACEYTYKLANGALEVYNLDRQPYEGQIKYYTDEEERIKKTLAELEKEIAKLEKHKLLHAFALKKKNKRKKALEDSLVENKKEAEPYRESLIEIDGKILNTIATFKKRTGLEVLEYTQKLEEAREEIENIDIATLENEIIVLSAQLHEWRTKLDEIEREIIIARGANNVMLTTGEEKRNTI